MANQEENIVDLSPNDVQKIPIQEEVLIEEFFSSAGGSGIIKKSNIQSPNFATGLTGWKIDKTGDAEFNSITVRGVVITKPVTRIYKFTSKGSSTTQFDITNPSGTTFRYTYDGIGTNPNISAATMPVGTIVSIFSDNFTFANNGNFTVTGSGSNFFEITNASGVAENNKTIGSRGQLKIFVPTTWSKPTGLQYVVVEALGGGGGSAGTSAAGDTAPGGGGGGYSKKYIIVDDLGATETITVGAGGISGNKTGGTAGTSGQTSSFGSHCQATGGGGSTKNSTGPTGGLGSNGDLNLQAAGGGVGTSGGSGQGGQGGDSFYGGGNNGGVSGASGSNGGDYGGGAGGAHTDDAGTDQWGGHGAPGVVIVTEFYI